MSLRYVPPLNNSASQKADDDFYANHPEFVKPDGTRIPLSGSDPSQESLRQEWLAAYKNHGGNVKGEPETPNPPPKPVLDCPPEKTVTAKVVALTFRSDHLDPASGKKLLRPSAGDFKDAAAEFTKPEWQASPNKSDPISHTKNQNVTVDVDIEFTVTPAGCSASVTKIIGDCGDAYLSFERDESASISTGVQPFKGLVSKGTLPDNVDLLKSKNITWKVMADGQEKTAGTTGPHKIYVTFAGPHGKMDSSLGANGPDQDVTEERLEYSVEATKGKGKTDEKECVDGIFAKYTSLRLVYTLGERWPDTTGAMTLHHYLWRISADLSKGECHMLAAAFALACQILGVKGSFEVGFFRPWGRRSPDPSYAARGADPLRGKYNTIDWRTHSSESHDRERIGFVDGNGLRNQFEGVATYDNKACYAIGEGKYDKYTDLDKNASDFYKGGHDNGAFKLYYKEVTGGFLCDKPYPPHITGKTDFNWTE